MEITDRLEELVSRFARSNSAFAHGCGLKQTTFDRQIRGVSVVSLETVQAILAHHPEVSAEWLVMGRGEMEVAREPGFERLNRLVDTIALLQQTINEKNETIRILKEKLNKSIQ